MSNSLSDTDNIDGPVCDEISWMTNSSGGAASSERLYAFTLANGIPLVMEFELNEDGLSELANLLRSEQVLAVIRGIKAVVRTESVVRIEAGGLRSEDRLKLTEAGAS